MMKRKLLVGSLLMIASSPIFAQVGADSDTTREQSVKEVRVISSYGKERKTPVAMSTVNAKQISEVYGGSAELPEVLKVTPGVYATKTGGGVGDSRINIRGFDQGQQVSTARFGFQIQHNAFLRPVQADKIPRPVVVRVIVAERAVMGMARG